MAASAARPAPRSTGAGPSSRAVAVPYWCSAGHESRPVFATTAEIPDSWPCDRCGRPAGRSEEAPPPPPPPLGASPKTPWEFLMMRRTVEEGEKLLDEALAKLRANRDGR